MNILSQMGGLLRPRGPVDPIAVMTPAHPGNAAHPSSWVQRTAALLQALRPSFKSASLAHLRKVVTQRLSARRAGDDDLGPLLAPLWPYPLGTEADLVPVPWPRDPEGMAASVLRLPAADLADFLVFIVSRYEATLLLYAPVAASDALRDPTWHTTSNAEFTAALTDSSYSRFLMPGLASLSEDDARAFARVLSYPEARWFTVDFTAMAHAEPLPGLFVAPTVTLLREWGQGQLEPVAIRVGELLVTPDDVPTWTLAKLFVMQGAAYHLISLVHPRLHFPMDPINALTRSVLPAGHVLRRLLEPHLRFSLALNVGVRDHVRSVARNDQGEAYTPFGIDGDSIFRLFRIGYRGLPGKAAYPAYRYPMGPTKLYSGYGTYLAGYYRCVLAFTERVCATIPRGDDAVRRWADAIAAFVPGFPAGAEIFRGDNLALATATFLFTVSVAHSADHHDYAGGGSAIDVRQSPLRLRVPPPRAPLPAPVPIEDTATPEDLFRYLMAWKMFFAPTTLRRLDRTRYRFDAAREPALVTAADAFLRGLRAWDQNMSCRRYAPLSALSRSIEY